eukprot:TRINITY_DN2101_c0_g1_i1.p1 TRINITY_DN2101_c0_g1~~TRINITY_DN2101_c0_g1_i1.p1  ORF type:complete len:134 (-),score=20.89 TRINITY_DN2101_c0_g1_i1:259-633(-)
MEEEKKFSNQRRKAFQVSKHLVFHTSSMKRKVKMGLWVTSKSPLLPKILDIESESPVIDPETYDFPMTNSSSLYSTSMNTEWDTSLSFMFHTPSDLAFCKSFIAWVWFARISWKILFCSASLWR